VKTLEREDLAEYIASVKDHENTNLIGEMFTQIIRREKGGIAGGSGADIVANITLGRVAHWATLPAASDALIVVPLETTGLVADATIRDYDDLSTLLAGATNEQTTMGRKTISASVTVTVDDTNERVDVDCPDQVWTGATGNAISKLLFCYDGDTGAGTDANILPLTFHSFDVTPDGSDVTAQIAALGFFRAQ